MQSLRYRILAGVCSVLLSGLSWAQGIADFVPKGAKHCALTQPPPDAGLIATPGGFLMVYPRNAALQSEYTGCKLLWIVETEERYLKLATLYFKAGKLALAASHDFRNAPEQLEAACAFPQAKSLLPNSGRQVTDEECAQFEAEGLYALRTPSWPRQCALEPENQICQEDPR